MEEVAPEHWPWEAPGFREAEKSSYFPIPTSFPLTAPHHPRLEPLPSTQAPRALSCVFHAGSVLELTESLPRGSELRTLGSGAPLARSSACKFTCALESAKKAGSFIRSSQEDVGPKWPRMPAFRLTTPFTDETA